MDNSWASHFLFLVISPFCLIIIAAVGDGGDVVMWWCDVGSCHHHVVLGVLIIGDEQRSHLHTETPCFLILTAVANTCRYTQTIQQQQQQHSSIHRSVWNLFTDSQNIQSQHTISLDRRGSRQQLAKLGSTPRHSALIVSTACEAVCSLICTFGNNGYQLQLSGCLCPPRGCVAGLIYLILAWYGFTQW